MIDEVLTEAELAELRPFIAEKVSELLEITRGADAATTERAVCLALPAMVHAELPDEVPGLFVEAFEARGRVATPCLQAVAVFAAEPLSAAAAAAQGSALAEYAEAVCPPAPRRVAAAPGPSSLGALRATPNVSRRRPATRESGAGRADGGDAADGRWLRPREAWAARTGMWATSSSARGPESPPAAAPAGR